MSNQAQDEPSAPIIPPIPKEHSSSSQTQIDQARKYGSGETYLVVDYHENLREACISIIKGDATPNWDGNNTHKKELLQQKNPRGNTVLHIAAMYGNDVWVDKIAKEVADVPHLFIEQNENGDTPLHVAAKAGHISTVKNLLVAHYTAIRNSDLDRQAQIMKEFCLEKNNQGNTFFDEAIYGRHQGLLDFLLNHHEGELNFLENILDNYTLLSTNNEDKSGLYLMIEAGYNQLADRLLAKLTPTYVNGEPRIPLGRLPLHAAILKRDQGILDMILTRKPGWIDLRYVVDGRMGLHYAASIGYLDGVNYLVGKRSAQARMRDKYGFFPIHLAAIEGHVEVVHKLLERLDHYCPCPRDLVDNRGRNILHIAIEGGKFNIVKYILHQSNINNHELEKMINDKDFNGNTPLHVATLCCLPRTVHELTRDKRVVLTLTNNEGQTALDVCKPPTLGRLLPLRQSLTMSALISGGVKSAKKLHGDIEVHQNTKSFWQEEAPKTDEYKERTSTLILVATLIVTVTFAAGFTLPGGINTESHKEKGMALMLHNILFKLFMIFNTASMYGAIGVIIALIWAQLGDLTLFVYAFKVAMPLLGFTLATLSLAFLTGVELVISHITWLATFIGVMSFIFMLLSFFLYAPLSIPTSTRNPLLKYLSLYFLLIHLWILVDPDDAKVTDSTHSIPKEQAQAQLIHFQQPDRIHLRPEV